MIRASILRLLLSLLFVAGLAAGPGRTSCDAGGGMGHHGMAVSAPAGHGHDHAKLPGHARKASNDCACCSMACCSAVLPWPASVAAARVVATIRYAESAYAAGGVGTALDPDPPRQA